MLYNIVLVSAVQQSESAVSIHISPYPLPLEPPSHPPYPTLYFDSLQFSVSWTELGPWVVWNQMLNTGPDQQSRILVKTSLWYIAKDVLKLT